MGGKNRLVWGGAHQKDGPRRAVSGKTPLSRRLAVKAEARGWVGAQARVPEQGWDSAQDLWVKRRICSRGR